MKKTAWEDILDEHALSLNQGVSPPLTSQEIKAATDGEEPRTVCYMDSRESVPDSLHQDDLFVLPIENGVYKLVEGKGFADLPKIETSIERWEHEIPFEFDTNDGSGEDQYLQYAFNTGLIDEFTDSDNLYSTSSGRRHSNRFRFNVGRSQPITAEGVQFQVDGLYEGPDQIIIVEAKVNRGGERRRDFLIRQLYYPYRHYNALSEKTVRTVFMVYNQNADLYQFWEYSFDSETDYASISLETSQRYRIQSQQSRLSQFADLTTRTSVGWSIPQADSVWRIQEIPVLVDDGITDSTALAEYYDFHRRQANYYAKATEENLGLIDRSGAEYTLTERGREYVKQDTVGRHELFAQQILSMPLMGELFDRLTGKLGHPDSALPKSEIESVIREHTDLEDSSLARRTDSVLTWFEWLSSTIGVVEVENGCVRFAEYVHQDNDQYFKESQGPR